MVASPSANLCVPLDLAHSPNGPKFVKSLDEMPLSLKSLAAFLPWRGTARNAEKIYEAIVAQARLPIHYQDYGIPDTLEGRFAVLSLYLFAVLHRLKGGGAAATAMAQALVDRFTSDMDTVLREMGVGDLSVPKKVRKLVASGAVLNETYERALAEGESALEEAIMHALPGEEASAKAASAKLTPYLREIIVSLENQSLTAICDGRLSFPRTSA